MVTNIVCHCLVYIFHIWLVEFHKLSYMEIEKKNIKGVPRYDLLSTNLTARSEDTVASTPKDAIPFLTYIVLSLMMALLSGLCVVYLFINGMSVQNENLFSIITIFLIGSGTVYSGFRTIKEIISHKISFSSLLISLFGLFVVVLGFNLLSVALYFLAL
jgi:hypothetical protein